MDTQTQRHESHVPWNKGKWAAFTNAEKPFFASRHRYG